METSSPAALRIGDVAQRVGVNTGTIRYYENIGLLPDPERTAAGYRLYGDDDIERLQFIKSAQRLGIALDEIGEILALRDRGEQPCAYVRQVLRREVTDIDRRIRELRRLRQELVAIEARADEPTEDEEAVICRLIQHVRQKDRPEPGSRAQGLA